MPAPSVATEELVSPPEAQLTQSAHLQRLEAESIHILREVVNPVLLCSIGKDSSVILHLALKAFYPLMTEPVSPKYHGSRTNDSVRPRPC